MIELDEIDSTNNYLRGYRPYRPVDITLVTAEHQTAGRGQRGNSWESARSQNLLFSILVQPTALPATHLFVLSEAIALSIRDAIVSMTGSDVTVKWPNDIYVADRKIAGILIENDLQGSAISRAIIGCGVNINQEAFVSDAPNPVSLRQLLHRETERRFVLESIIGNFTHLYDDIQRGHFDDIHSSYLASLYRRCGLHVFRDAGGTFNAEIADVEPTGFIVLRDTNGRLRRYAFKEVAFLAD